MTSQHCHDPNDPLARRAKRFSARGRGRAERRRATSRACRWACTNRCRSAAGDPRWRDEHALVARPGEARFRKQVGPGAEAPDVLVRRRTVVELEQRRRAAAHDRRDQSQRSRVAEPGDRRPEVARDPTGDLAQRQRVAGARRPRRLVRRRPRTDSPRTTRSARPSLGASCAAPA